LYRQAPGFIEDSSACVSLMASRPVEEMEVVGMRASFEVPGVGVK
jgi:hypothetical protein